MEPEWRAIAYQEDGGGEEEEAQTVVVTTVSCGHGRSHHLAAYRGKVFVLDSFPFGGIDIVLLLFVNPLSPHPRFFFSFLFLFF